MTDHPQLHRLQPAQREPAIEGTGHAPEGVLQEADGLEDGGVLADHGPLDQVRVPGEILRHAVDDQIRAQRELLVRALQDRKRLAYLRYRGGVDTMLNALNSDQELFVAELSVARAGLDELLSLVQLHRAVGGGWQ